jgi:hypothetical protein
VYDLLLPTLPLIVGRVLTSTFPLAASTFSNVLAKGTDDSRRRPCRHSFSNSTRSTVSFLDYEKQGKTKIHVPNVATEK